MAPRVVRSLCMVHLVCAEHVHEMVGDDPSEASHARYQLSDAEPWVQHGCVQRLEPPGALRSALQLIGAAFSAGGTNAELTRN